jgi:hypothetical protein
VARVLLEHTILVHAIQARMLAAATAPGCASQHAGHYLVPFKLLHAATGALCVCITLDCKAVHCWVPLLEQGLLRHPPHTTQGLC